MFNKPNISLSPFHLCLQGNGFVTDPTVIAQNGFSDPNPFFQQLMTKPYLNNVIISPHLYGSSVSLVSSGYSGVELYNKLSTSVGYLNKQGYCMGTNCHVFPILVGETGSDLQDPRDLAFYESLRKYLKLEGDANDGCHNAITNVMWWSYNANSGGKRELEWFFGYCLSLVSSSFLIGLCCCRYQGDCPGRLDNHQLAQDPAPRKAHRSQALVQPSGARRWHRDRRQQRNHGTTTNQLSICFSQERCRVGLVDADKGKHNAQRRSSSRPSTGRRIRV